MPQNQVQEGFVPTSTQGSTNELDNPSGNFVSAPVPESPFLEEYDFSSQFWRPLSIWNPSPFSIRRALRLAVNLTIVIDVITLISCFCWTPVFQLMPEIEKAKIHDTLSKATREVEERRPLDKKSLEESHVHIHELINLMEPAAAIGYWSMAASFISIIVGCFICCMFKQDHPRLIECLAWLSARSLMTISILLRTIYHFIIAAKITSFHDYLTELDDDSPDSQLKNATEQIVVYFNATSIVMNTVASFMLLFTLFSLWSLWIMSNYTYLYVYGDMKRERRVTPAVDHQCISEPEVGQA